MSKNTRVLNVTRGFRLRFNQARRAVEQCACAWVEHGVSVRDLTLAEAIAARNKRKKDAEPLPYLELRGIVCRMAAAEDGAARRSRTIAHVANHFALSAGAPR